ncbi:hypothetical protein EPIR_3024 [Erwinia piriflorinigrans CFBP 5888]|uniref:Uncharacterized protein n=1 Tax=Erwinia piriflorinigrans CFBP 5888 TaxID=1161919 RepID=V5ZBS1_9GAMM|nr:hypothetical protein EPIR_3024 [Erwinia piriflorinigrans CFBP 5888]
MSIPFFANNFLWQEHNNSQVNAINDAAPRRRDGCRRSGA